MEHAEVPRFHRDHELVFVWVTQNRVPDAAPATWTANGFTCHEALLTHEGIRTWSPTVAYSACDAQVLSPG